MTALLALFLFAAVEDLGVGTWHFNAAASTYESASAPRQSKRVWSKRGDKVHFFHTGTSAEGKPFQTEFIAAYDGKDYPFAGGSLYNTVALNLVDAHNVDQTFKKDGRVTVTARRTISPDGKRMTIVAVGATNDGRKFKNVLVYDRAP